MLRNSYIFKDPYSDRELKSLSKELLNPELKNLRTITQEEKHKYVTQFDQILASKTTTIPKNVNKLHVTLEEKKFALSLESKTISELTEYIEYSINTASQELSDFLANYRNEKLRKTSLKNDYYEVAKFIKNILENPN